MKKKNIITIILIVWIFNPTICSQVENRVLAKIGSDVITVEDFKDRFEFMPHLNYTNNNIDTVKKEFLYSLIAEKLWAKAADEMGLNTIESVKLSLKTLQNFFVKDELYKQEVDSKIVIAEQEIATGLSRVNRILDVDLISSQDSLLINKFYDLALNISNMDSLINLFGLKKTRYEIKYGSLQDSNIENIIYSLKLNQISAPINIKGQWLVIKLLNDENDKTIIPGTDHAKNLVIKKLKDQKAQIIGRKFLDNLLYGKSVTADKKLFELITEYLFEVLKNRYNSKDSLKKIQLEEIDILNVQRRINKNDLESNFIHLEDNHITINYFLYYLIYQKINFALLTLKDVKQTLNLAIKQFIEDLILAEEGKKRGLENSYTAKHDLKLWKEYYLAEVLMNSYTDSIKISDYDVDNFIKLKIDSSVGKIQVNIIEILTDNLDDVEKIFSDINNGTRFEDLASIYNKREWTKKSNGEWGFFNADFAGEIGRIAVNMQIGQIYGPLKVPEGYSVFKLIAKRTDESNQINSSFEEDKKFIRLKLALKKMDDLINEKTIYFAKKYNISVDDQLLKSIETSELNTFTYRLIGFGGKIAAFPITIPVFKWYYDFKNQKEIP